MAKAKKVVKAVKVVKKTREGRKRLLSDKTIEMIKKQHASKKATAVELAKKHGVSIGTIYLYLNK